MERPAHWGVATSGLLDGIRKQAEQDEQGQPVNSAPLWLTVSASVPVSTSCLDVLQWWGVT